MEGQIVSGQPLVLRLSRLLGLSEASGIGALSHLFELLRRHGFQRSASATDAALLWARWDVFHRASFFRPVLPILRRSEVSSSLVSCITAPRHQRLEQCN